MITEKELAEAISELENSASTYRDVERLSALYNVHSHMHGETQSKSPDTLPRFGNSEFLTSVSGKDPESVLKVIDDLMTTLQAIAPKIYTGTIKRLKDV